MLHSGRFIAILDANVLYPAPVRDLLLSLADEGLFSPKWSIEINHEWVRNLVKTRPELSELLHRTIEVMNTAFPDAQVENYETLIEVLELPDPNDRHVVAAAIRCRAEVIVTNNLKDFPVSQLSQYDIEAQHPDVFISNMIDLDPMTALKGLKEQVARLRNPPLPIEKVLNALNNCGLPESVSAFRGLLN